MNDIPMPGDPLLDAARWLGCLPAYEDHAGVRRRVSRGSLRAVAAAVAGMPDAGEDELVDWVAGARAVAARRVVEPVVVLWQPDPPVVPLRPSGRARLTVTVTIDDADPQRGGACHVLEVVGEPLVDLTSLSLPVGRHRLAVSGRGVPEGGGEATVVVAPRRLRGIAEVVGGGDAGCGSPDDGPRHGSLNGRPRGGRPWGVFAPVWSAWSAERPEVHLGALDGVGAWVAGAGASLVGTLPLLATFADRPCEPSPYSPVSRRRWNEALIDLRVAPGFDACPEARRLADAVAPADPSAPWDPVAHWAAVRPVLEVLADRARGDAAAVATVAAAVAADPELADYAWFRAEVERRGAAWHDWPDGLSTGGTDVRGDPAVWRWAWSQWLVAHQLAQLADRFRDRGQALYLDLALGAHPDGFDTWADPSLFGWGAAVGAPPDAMFGGGQDWGFPPQRPEEARRRGHEEWARALRTHFGVGGVLRLDHVLGLQRLYWVPAGRPATEGVYVRQPLEELLAVLAVEADRAAAAAVGEDLGTVDPAVRHAMAEHRIAGMYVAQFAVAPGGEGATSWPARGQLAAVNTHDLPTFVGWMGAADADHRERAGLLDGAGRVEVRRQRSAEVASLRRSLGVDQPDPGEDAAAGWLALLTALLARLGATEADAVLVSVDDLVGAAEQQNVPGTPWSRPNWVVRLPEPLEVLAADCQVADLLGGLAAARCRGHRDEGA